MKLTNKYKVYLALVIGSVIYRGYEGDTDGVLLSLAILSMFLFLRDYGKEI